MFLGVWLAMFALAVGATAVWALLETRIPLATTTGTGAWAWLAYRSEQVGVASGGVVITQEAPYIQLFALFMALVSTLGLLLWWMGDFPPEETEESLDEMENITA